MPHRRAQGIPRIDKHIYARENGWAINGARRALRRHRRPAVLDEARRAATGSSPTARSPAADFRHGDADANGPYLGDTLAMARAFLALYGATADRQWLARAEATMKFIDANFKDHAWRRLRQLQSPHRSRLHLPTLSATKISTWSAPPTCFSTSPPTRPTNKSPTALCITSPPTRSSSACPPPARCSPTSKSPTNRCTSPSSAPRTDPVARALFLQALQYPSSYKRLEWWDPSQGPAGRLPNPDVQYPSLKVSAAFICTSRTCSPPIFKPADVPAKIDRLLAATSTSRRCGQLRIV